MQDGKGRFAFVATTKHQTLSPFCRLTGVLKCVNLLAVSKVIERSPCRVFVAWVWMKNLWERRREGALSMVDLWFVGCVTGVSSGRFGIITVINLNTPTG